MYYNLSNYDKSGGYGTDNARDPVLGHTVGSTFPKYIFDIEDEEDEDSDIDYEDFDDIDKTKLKKKSFNSFVVPADDVGIRDPQTFASGNSLYLEDQTHTNTTMKGMSPGLAYRGNSKSTSSGGGRNTPGSNQPFRTTGNFRRTGTQYGTSRPHKLLTKVEDENIFNLDQILDPMERSFVRQQNRIKILLKNISEVLLL